MTDSGDNDTSVQNAQPAGNPAEVRFPMMTARNCQSVRGIFIIPTVWEHTVIVFNPRNIIEYHTAA